ncbi:MAG: MarR family winged helix-turn-helix transcriptional regulator [Microthrixaceae bacterium]
MSAPRSPRSGPTARRADAVRAAARLAKVAGSALHGAELTLPQYRVLVFLAVRSRPATHVAALLGVSASTMTSVVDGLAARGLVSRSADPGDRRRVLLDLTPEGERLLAAGDEVVGAGLERLLARLDASDAETVVRGLELLNQAMELSLDERFGSGFRDPERATS